MKIIIENQEIDHLLKLYLKSKLGLTCDLKDAAVTMSGDRYFPWPNGIAIEIPVVIPEKEAK